VTLLWHAHKLRPYRHFVEVYRRTSVEAWEAALIYLGEIDRRIVTVIASSGGATCDAVERALNLKHQTASAQIRHLFEGGVLCDSGRRAATGSGRRAIVWTLINRTEGEP
jgi:hypothetical protein